MVVTLRNVKGSALTHSELDANFTTLQSETATILDSAQITSIATALDNAQSILDSADVTAIVQATGASGIDSAATISLINAAYINNLVSQGINDLTNVDISGIQNGQVLKWAAGSSTFVPGNDSAGSGGGSSYSNADVDTHLNTGTATSNQILSWTGTDYDWITGTGGASFDQTLNTTDSVEFAGLIVNGPMETTTTGTPTVTANSNLVLEIGGSVTISKNSSNAGGGFRVATLTSTQRNALSAANGEIVYNSSTNKLQTYENNAWEDVISSSSTPGATFTLTSNGASDYTFAADGRFFPTNVNDPVLYLRRGETYTFINNSGGSHPLAIRVSNGGAAYNTGVTNNGASSGNVVFTVPMSAPTTLYYQCTAHAGMGNTINIV